MLLLLHLFYFVSSISVLNYCVPTLSDTDSLTTFIKNNHIILNNVVDGVGMVEWMKYSKEVNNLISKIK